MISRNETDLVRPWSSPVQARFVKKAFFPRKTIHNIQKNRCSFFVNIRHKSLLTHLAHNVMCFYENLNLIFFGFLQSIYFLKYLDRFVKFRILVQSKFELIPTFWIKTVSYLYFGPLQSHWPLLVVNARNVLPSIIYIVNTQTLKIWKTQKQKFNPFLSIIFIILMYYLF